MQTQNVNDVIDHLAAKLSVPASHLYSVLVSQARVSAIQDGFAIAFFLAFLALFWSNEKRMRASANTDEDSIWVMPLIFGYIGTLISVVFVVVFASTLTGELMNPEYYALKEILAALK